MRANIFCILLATVAVGTAGVVTVKYQELQDVCQVAGQVDMLHGAATDCDVEAALTEGFITLNEAVFMNDDPVDCDADFCEEVINLLEESISEAFSASDGSSEVFENVLVQEIREGLTTLEPELIMDEDVEVDDLDEEEDWLEEDWLDEDDLFDEGKDDWSEDDWSEDDWPEDDWPEEDENWLEEDLDAEVFGD